MKALRVFVVLFVISTPNVLLAQNSMADSAGIIVIAVRGYVSPNGPLSEINPAILCESTQLTTCPGHPAGARHAPALLRALAAALTLPVPRDTGFSTPNCPWSALGEPHGVTLNVGQLIITGDSARIDIGRSCRSERGFAEGGTVVLRRTNGVWQAIEVQRRRMA